MKDKIVKLAVIRKDSQDPCPFGLRITNGCRNAGELITKMAPLDAMGPEATKKERKAILKANRRLYMWNSEGGRCSYAGKIMNEQGAVECNFRSNAPGITEKGILGAPFYSKVYNNIGLDGIYSYPLGYYADNNISRNLYYGMYSLMGSDGAEDDIKKFAEYLLELDGHFLELSMDEQAVLRSFASDYANNKLFKKGMSDINLDTITTILECWKDKNESS